MKTTAFLKYGAMLVGFLAGAATVGAVGEERYYGGAFNGDAHAEYLVYPQADLQQRFAGGSLDGADQREVIQNPYADVLLRFAGGGYDGQDEGSDLNQPNPLMSDSDGDELVDWWELIYMDSLTILYGPGDHDGDGATDLHELIADTIPTGSNSFFRITSIERTNSVSVAFTCTNSRTYSLEKVNALVTGDWSFVSSQTNVSGSASGNMSLIDTNTAALRMYRVRVRKP